jgi:hypothetical protein
MILYAILILLGLCGIFLLARGAERRLVVGAVVVRVAMGMLVWPFLVAKEGTFVTTNVFLSDDFKYFQAGCQFLSEGTLFVTMESLGIEVNPGFPYLVGALFLFFGKVWFIPNGISFLAGALLPVLVSRLALSLGLEKKKAHAAGWLMVLLPSAAFFSVVGYKDMLILCVVTSLFWWLVSVTRESFRIMHMVGVAIMCAALAFLRVGALPLVVFSYAAIAIRVQTIRRSIIPVALLLVGVVPFFAWLESTQFLDRFTLEEITSTARSGEGMASTILTGGLSTWPLRAALFLILPYPSLTGIEDAWQLYTWLNLGWYVLLCLALPGVLLLVRDARDSNNRFLLLPLAWSAAIVLSLMVRGIPNSRYVLMVYPAVAIMAAYTVTSRRAMVTALALIGIAPILMFGGYALLRSVL